MTRPALALVLVLLGCAPGVEPSEYESVDGLFADLCGPVQCRTEQVCPDGYRWGYYDPDEGVCIGEALCFSDLTLCTFVLRHELCHAAGVEWEADADCCAAAQSSKAQNDAAERYLCATNRDDERCQAVKECRG